MTFRHPGSDPLGAGATGAEFKEAGEAGESHLSVSDGGRLSGGESTERNTDGRGLTLGPLPTSGDRKTKRRAKTVLCPRRNRKTEGRCLPTSKFTC